MDDTAQTPNLLAFGQVARSAARAMALVTSAQKNKALSAIARRLTQSSEVILAANHQDVEAALKRGQKSSLIDRLTLNNDRLKGMAQAVEEIIAQPDPVGRVISSWVRPNGMKISRVRVPIGVIALIFESRPNVAIDASAIAIKAGNAAILRGGSDSFLTVQALLQVVKPSLLEAGLPLDAIQTAPTRDRAFVGELLQGLHGHIDLIIPRGGKSLVARVEADARVPVLSHLEGICHVYVDGQAQLEMAQNIVLNSKMRRTGVCGSAETILIDQAGANRLLKPLIQTLINAGCEVRGDAAALAANPLVKPATVDDWSTEYLDSIVTLGVVEGVEGAIRHIETYGSHHTDAIVTDDGAVAEKFLTEVDSALVLHNASTQLADGGEFGFGGEIGIATGKLHARGPVGAEQLTSFKYQIHGTGQTRP